MSTEEKHKMIEQTRTLISSWIQPFNAVVLFGGTTVAILDFLSPKLALLPIASMVAIVGFMIAAIGRKLLRPLGLRHVWLQEVLAPEQSFVKAPAVIFTGLLSV